MTASLHVPTGPDASVAPVVPAVPAPQAPDDPLACCPSCGGARPERFCGRCGEARVEPDDLTLRAFLAHAVEQFTSVDAALWRTARTLALRPGALTVDWLAGRRRGTAKPLQLFVLANVLFFVLLHATGGGFRFRLEQYTHGRLGSVFLGDTTQVQAMVARKAASEGLTVAAYATRFDAASAAQQSVWLLLPPTLAAVLALLYARRRLPLVQHLVFAVHFLAFMLVLLAVGMTAFGLLLRGVARIARTAAGAWPGLAHGLSDAVRYADGHEAVFGIPLLGLLSIYLFRALRHVYPEPWGWTAARTVALAYVLPRVFDVYRDVLFAITLWTT
jgi:hypothetical protein